MGRFRGVIGFITTSETEPGVFTEVVSERIYSGDIIQNSRRLEPSQNLIDNVTINNRFSVVGDEYLFTHYLGLRYIVFAGQKWKITGAEHQRPRMILTVGGLYNAPSN